MASKALVQLCEDLGRFLGAAHDTCALAWDSGQSPTIAAARGAVDRVFNASADSIEGSPAGTLFTGGERAARDLAQAAARGPIEEHRTLLRGGQPFPAQILLSSAPGGVVAVVRDLEASRGVVDAALRADDLARFASLVAHEVRNPLSAVKIALQTLERHGTLATNDLRRTSIALREVLNIELLLNEVLEFARPPSVTLIPGDPSTPVRDAVEGVEAEWQTRGVVFRCTVPERMPPVAIDPVRVRTAVKILCRQAAVAAEEVGGGFVDVAVETRDGGWELTVKDPGRPLPREQRTKAFVPFTPHRARGTGLGLAVVARIAREHRGEAKFLDTGEGNVISVTFAA
ncbi:MAG: HAMP domain-containing histidine kinase [Deltaproteobacteria bacterium]|nr:MAG: HAMP domain-containing histidine kinase [Deltaproteobacteria bacterium]TMB39553.1 MAG: HAMP domain-containing histidine kinase [Deltaproteobacteria bacterium]